MARLDNSSRQKFLDYMNDKGGFSGDQFSQFQADEQSFAGGFPDFASMGQQPTPQPVQPSGQQNGQVVVQPLPQRQDVQQTATATSFAPMQQPQYRFNPQNINYRPSGPATKTTPNRGSAQGTGLTEEEARRLGRTGVTVVGQATPGDTTATQQPGSNDPILTNFDTMLDEAQQRTIEVIRRYDTPAQARADLLDVGYSEQEVNNLMAVAFPGSGGGQQPGGQQPGDFDFSGLDGQGPNTRGGLPGLNTRFQDPNLGFSFGDLSQDPQSRGQQPGQLQTGLQQRPGTGTRNNPFGPPNSVLSRDPFFGQGLGSGGNDAPVFDDDYGDEATGTPGDPTYDNNTLQMNPLQNTGRWVDGKWVLDNPPTGGQQPGQQPRSQPNLTFEQIGDMNQDGKTDFNDFLLYQRTQGVDTREGGGELRQPPLGRQDPGQRTANADPTRTLTQPGGQPGGDGQQGGGQNLNYNGVDIPDLNGDGKVDFNDFLEFRTRMVGNSPAGGELPGTGGGQGGGELRQPGGDGQQGGGQNLNYNGVDIPDLNGDGKVDFNDFLEFRTRMVGNSPAGGELPGTGGGQGGGLPGQNAPGFGLDDILNGLQKGLPGWMGSLLDRYQQGGQGGGGGQGGDSSATGGSATGGSVGNITVNNDTSALTNLLNGFIDKTGGFLKQLPGLLTPQGDLPDINALQMLMGTQLGGVQSGLDDIFTRLGQIEGRSGDGSGGFDFGDLPDIGLNGTALTKPAREAGTVIDTTRELKSIDASITNPEILSTVEGAIKSRLGGNVADDPRVALQLADLEKSQTDRKNQRIEDLKRMGINADDGNYFSEGDKLGESFNRERLNVLSNGEMLRNADLSTGLNLGNIQGGLNTSDAQLGLQGDKLGFDERMGLGGLQLNERSQDIGQRGQDAQFDLSGARMGLDQLLGVGNLDVRRDEANTRTKQLEAEIEDARNARKQQNLTNLIALLNGNNGKGLIDRGLDLYDGIFGKKDGE
jgi:hypothetical protein